jgi:hypothetical protein
MMGLRMSAVEGRVPVVQRFVEVTKWTVIVLWAETQRMENTSP